MEYSEFIEKQMSYCDRCEDLFSTSKLELVYCLESEKYKNVCDCCICNIEETNQKIKEYETK